MGGFPSKECRVEFLVVCGVSIGREGFCGGSLAGYALALYL